MSGPGEIVPGLQANIDANAAVLAAEGAGQARLATTKDHAAAVEDFLAKRRPTFTGE